MVEVKKTEGIEFKWGLVKSTGGKDKSTHFYKDFSYDGVQYDLYDSVYLYKDGESEPEIGKIIKMWETKQGVKKAKILWFFRPCEIINFLGDEKVLENELFLASGKGVGLFNMNPVVSIAGKCNVVCISKNKENHQPTDEELQKADFVFYRTFDVLQQKIMDTIEGQIADVDVKFLFNKMNIQKPVGNLDVDLGENKVCHNDTTSETMVPTKQNSFKEHMNLETKGNSVDKHKLSVEKPISATVGLESGEMDKTDARQHDASGPKIIVSSKRRIREEVDNIIPRKLEVEETRSTKDVDSDNRPTKKVKLDTSKVSSDKSNSHEQKHAAEENNNSRKGNAMLEHTQPEKVNMNASRSIEHKHKTNAIKDLSPIASPVDEGCNIGGLEDTIGIDKSPTKVKPNGNTIIPTNDELTKSLRGDGKSESSKASLSSSSTVDDKCKCKDRGESLEVDNDSQKKLKASDGVLSKYLHGDGKTKTQKNPSPSSFTINDKCECKDGGESLVVDKDFKKMNASNEKLLKSLDGDGKSKVQKTSSASSLIVDDKCERKDGGESLVVDKDSKKKMKVGDKATNLSAGKPPRLSLRPAQNKAQKFDGQVLEGTRCSDVSNVDGNGSKASSPIARFDDSLGKHKAPFKKTKSNVEAPRLPNRELQEQPSTQSQIKSGKLGGQVVEVTPRPEADKSSWFKNFPWQERMHAAHEQGTLVLFQNLDPSYTSAEVQNIVWGGFGESCTAKMIQQTASSSPYYGQALVIFKTRETAKKVVTKLYEGCLLLSNGRPLVGSMARTCSTEKTSKFFGHLVIDKRHSMLNDREMREAVSTSHFSQPNTIEYDMSMEWCVEQDKSDLLWKNLYQQQGKEVRELKAKLKAK